MLHSLKSFKHMFAAANHKQMISLRLEHQKRNEENDCLKNCKPEVMAYELSQRISKKMSGPMNTTHKGPTKAVRTSKLLREVAPMP